MSTDATQCPECYGGHFRPCQVCGDTGFIEVVPGQIHACDCKRKPAMKPLFIPLKAEYFEAFERGEKPEEYRIYGQRWNEKTCAIGRPVVLSYGYGKKRRLRGVVSSFSKCYQPYLLPGWNACYPTSNHPAACIGIKVEGKL